jgi:hypothetical protein
VKSRLLLYTGDKKRRREGERERGREIVEAASLEDLKSKGDKEKQSLM